MALPTVTAAAPLQATAAAAPPARSSFGAVLRERAPAKAPATALAAKPPEAAARAALASVECARQRLESALAAARQGRTFSASELLALQADAYRYSQTVEVASKVVEHGAQAVKQAVNTQV